MVNPNAKRVARRELAKGFSGKHPELMKGILSEEAFAYAYRPRIPVLQIRERVGVPIMIGRRNRASLNLRRARKLRKKANELRRAHGIPPLNRPK